MAKFSGKIGFAHTIETSSGSGVWEDTLIIEKPYRGDIIRDSRSWQPSETLNDNFHIRNNSISIVADTFAFENIANLRYVVYLGVKWKVTSIDVSQRPRLILTLGGEYNGE